MDDRKAGTRIAAKADWNVVVTLSDRSYREARKLLGKWGAVRRTPYYNVLGMKVENPADFLARFSAAVEEAPGILNFFSHVVPAQQTFAFDTTEGFETQARNIALGWASELAGKSFHVRLHRRGFKGTLSTPKEERFLDEALLAAPGASRRITFDDPDAIIQIETIDGRAGMSLWTRDDIRRNPFLGAD